MKPIVVSHYLPQYHPIPENDEWWEPGFTEWTNVTKATPLYRGHYQPNLPADLGFYDLRLPEAREAQANLARQYGVDAFCYYHYWFGQGKTVLERPLQEVIKSGRPDFPFMVCWANQTWAGVWHGLKDRVLIRQEYPGDADIESHFKHLLPIFNDPRYLKIDGKPVFMIYKPTEIPDSTGFLAKWRQLAADNGLPGLYLLCEMADPSWDAKTNGYDAFVNMRHLSRRRNWSSWQYPASKLKDKILNFLGKPTILDYREMSEYFVPKTASSDAIPCVLAGWDNTPRSGRQGLVLEGSTPEAFGQQLRRGFERVATRGSDGLLFIKSWNEWAEGNHLEPGRRWGLGYLQKLAAEKSRYK